MSPAKKKPVYYTIKQFLDLAKISKAALYQRWRVGSGPGRFRVQIEGSPTVLIPIGPADQWLKDNPPAPVREKQSLAARRRHERRRHAAEYALAGMASGGGGT